MSAPAAPPGLACPVCGRPVPGPGPAPCGGCGLPAVAQAASVVGRLGATLRDLAADRDALLATLRAAAPGRISAPPAPVPPTPVSPTPAAPVVVPPPPQPRPAPEPEPAPWPFPPQAEPPEAVAPPPPRRPRLSPQQVLLGLGALLVVAAAIAFVAVAWTRLGVTFQAAVMSAVTALACGASAWTARRGLRATEEALAAAGIALLAVDLGAARALGLFGLEEVPVRLWTAVSCLVVVAAALLLARLTRSTATWPLAALLAAQPVPFLLLPAEAVIGAAGVAAALAFAAGDLLVAGRLRRGLSRVARMVGGMQAAVGMVGGLLVARFADPVESWTATALLAAAGAAAVWAATRTGEAPLPDEPLPDEPLPDEPLPDDARLPLADLVPAGAAGVVGLSLAFSLDLLGAPGPVVAAGLGLAVLVAAVLLAGRRVAEPAAWSGGAVLAATGALLLADERRWAVLSALALAAVLPAALAALRRPELRSPATGTAVAAAATAVLLAHAGDVLAAPTAGLLLALVAATAFGTASLRAGEPEERVAAGAAALTGLAAAATTGTVGAWGQVAIQLTVVGAAAAAYAIVSGRRAVAAIAVADLVVAAWIALAGAHVTTPEAYTLPAAAGLLLFALPRLRAGAPSWTAEGPAAAVALAPSAMVVVADPTALRLVLVVAGAAVLTVAATLTHRRAPFVVGTVALAFVVVGRLGPYAPSLPRWLSLGAAGLLLLVVGATYERRRQQAREVVAWVAQMR